MFGTLGLPELIFIFILALLIFGPKGLPQVGRTLGRAMAEFRKASTDLRRTINAELLDEEMRAADPRKIVRDSLADVKKGLDQSFDPPPAGRRDDTDGAEAESVVAAEPEPSDASDGPDGMDPEGVGSGAEPGAVGTVARGATFDDEPTPAAGPVPKDEPAEPDETVGEAIP